MNADEYLPAVEAGSPECFASANAFLFVRFHAARWLRRMRYCKSLCATRMKRG
jgi:hypothetical protein